MSRARRRENGKKEMREERGKGKSKRRRGINLAVWQYGGSSSSGIQILLDGWYHVPNRKQNTYLPLLLQRN